MAQFVGEVRTDGQSDGAGNSFRMFVLDEAARQKELNGYDIIQLTLGKSDLQLHDAIKEAIDDRVVSFSQDGFRFTQI